MVVTTIGSESCSTRGAPVPLPLNRHTILDAIDTACQQTTTHVSQISTATSLISWQWKRRRSEYHHDSCRVPLLFGVIGEGTREGSETIIVSTTFYFAYSTWDGRILYIDQIGPSLTVSSNDIALVVYPILADIGIRLQCRRYVPYKIL